MDGVETVSDLFPAASFIQKLNTAVSAFVHRGCKPRK
jgi:hypothetical protein